MCPFGSFIGVSGANRHRKLNSKSDLPVLRANSGQGPIPILRMAIRAGLPIVASRFQAPRPEEYSAEDCSEEGKKVDEPPDVLPDDGQQAMRPVNCLGLTRSTAPRRNVFPPAKTRL
jgi:hypothetical protein